MPNRRTHTLAHVVRVGFSLAVASTCSFAWAEPTPAESAMEPAAEQPESPETSRAAFERFIADHAAALEPLQAAIDRGEALAPTDGHRALLDELDHLAHQRDALWSRLWWHTDLNEALAEAKSTGKPVLSLRLLGRLDEPLSCANSRFFRAVLYPNAEVSAYLREHYVLHWHTVRPAPVLTVDFGDGRVLKQTITGNSVHYVLSGDGEVVDALPGMYAPEQFLSLLRDAELTANMCGAHPVTVPAAYAPAPRPPQEFRPADRAGALTFGKIMIENRPIRSMLPRGNGNDPARLLAAIPAQHDGAEVLDARARSLVLSQLGASNESATDPDTVVRAFETAVRADTALNMSSLRPQILALLADPSVRSSPSMLDRRVYDEVFLSPITDQWAGLVDPTAFSGLWTRDRMPGG